MLLNVDGVVRRTAANLDDPAMTWADKDYLLPYINQAWDDLYLRIAALGLDYSEVVQEIDVAANTSDLSAFQAEGQPLESIVVPMTLQWKLPTDENTEYAKHKIDYVEALPDVSKEVTGHTAYEWRGGSLFVTPSSVATTIRVRFKAYSVDLVDPTDKIIRGVGNILAWKTAEIVNAPNVRNNAAACNYCRGKAEEAIVDFEVLCTKQKQKINYRFGRTSGRSRRGMPGVNLRAN